MDLLKRVIEDYGLVRRFVFAEKLCHRYDRKRLKRIAQAGKTRSIGCRAQEKKRKSSPAKQAIVMNETDQRDAGTHYQRKSCGIQSPRQMIEKQRYQPLLRHSLGGGAAQLTAWRTDHVAFWLARASDHRSEPLPLRRIDIGGDYGGDSCGGAGVVSYAGWISGYGYAVIIGHGGGISLLRAIKRCSSVRNRASRGRQPIAECGSTGEFHGTALPLEVRVDGEPVNPMGIFDGCLGWCRYFEKALCLTHRH